MLAAIWLFNGDLRDITRSRENKIRVFDMIFASVGHADHKRPKRRSA